MPDSQAIEELIAKLDDPDPGTKRATARQLGETGDPRAVVPVISALEDTLDDENARTDVSVSLVLAAGDLRDLRSVPVLCRAALHAKQEPARNVARRMLVGLGAEVAKPLLVALETFGSAGNQLRDQIFREVRGEDVRAILREDLRNPSAGIAAGAATLLGSVGEKADIPALLKVSRHSETTVRVAAISALGNLDAQAVDSALVGATKDRSPQVISAAIASLGKVGGNDHLSKIAEFARSHSYGNVRLAALTELRRHWPDEAHSVSLQILGDSSLSVRQLAATILGKSHTPSALQHLFHAFAREEDPETARVMSLAFVTLVNANPDEFVNIYGELVENNFQALTNILRPASKRIIDMLQSPFFVARQPEPFGLELPIDQIRRFPQNSERKLLSDTFGAPDETSVDLTELLTPPREDLSHSKTLTVVHPAAFTAGQWNTLLAYVHNQGAMADVVADCESRLKSSLGISRSSQSSWVKLHSETMITVRPNLPFCQINPPVASFSLEEDWHSVTFRVKPDDRAKVDQSDAQLAGSVSFYAHGVLVGQVSIWPMLGQGDAASEPVQNQAQCYGSIFPSYSRKDTEVVSSLARAYRALGMTILQDVEVLRSGENWAERLMELISSADIFQLFWSRSATSSQHVESEWRHALSLRRPSFIRPVFWHNPPPTPPDELSDLHFAAIRLD